MESAAKSNYFMQDFVWTGYFHSFLPSSTGSLRLTSLMSQTKVKTWSGWKQHFLSSLFSGNTDLLFLCLFILLSKRTCRRYFCRHLLIVAIPLPLNQDKITNPVRNKNWNKNSSSGLCSGWKGWCRETINCNTKKGNSQQETDCGKAHVWQKSWRDCSRPREQHE